MTMFVVVGNQKGGVGKTTLTLCLAAEFAQLGRKVLVVDLDAQVNLSTTIGVRGAELNIEDVLAARDAAPLADAIVPSQWEGIDAVAGSKGIEFLNIDPDGLAVLRLKEALEDAADAVAKYDVVLMDLPPALSRVAQSALMVADVVVPVVTPQALPIDGLQEFLTHLNKLKQRRRPDLIVHPVLVNKARHTNESKESVDEIIEVTVEAGHSVGDVHLPLWTSMEHVTSRQTPLRGLGKKGEEMANMVVKIARSIEEVTL